MKNSRPLLFVVALLLSGVGYFLGDPEGLGLCRINDVTCGNFYATSLGAPMFFFSLALLITSLALLFVGEEVYRAWRRFAYFAVPISVFLLAIAHTSSPSGFGIGGPGYTKESASWLVSALFLLISLYIILRKRPQA